MAVRFLRFHSCAGLLILSQLAVGVNINIPVVVPTAAPQVSSSLFSLSLEQDRWTDWVGTTSRNQFFFNVLDNLRVLSGEPPQIRIGADSEDRTNFNPQTQFAQETFPAITSIVPYPEASNVTVGDSYYQIAQFLPKNTHVIWGVNLGKNNITDAVLQAKSIAKAFSSSAIKSAGIVLDAIEIGNEADFYNGNGDRPSTYNSTQYVQDWTAFATNVSAAAGITASSNTQFWGGAFGQSSHSTSGFSPQAIFSHGILSSAPGALISTISQHRYSGSFCSGSGGLLQDLMTKSTIRSNLTIFTPDISAVHAKGLDYVLGETNSYACHGAPGVSNAAGVALWSLDYGLFATQLGISRVFFHNGVGYKYNSIQPIALTRSILDGSQLPSPIPPHVQPQYHASIIAAEAIGDSGSTRVTELVIDDPSLSGYAFFEGTKLARAVLINSKAFLTTDTVRPTIHVDLKFMGTAPKTVKAKRLAIGHADDTAGLTWGGQSYDTSDGRPSGKVVTETVNVQKGVDIKATEVVLLNFSS